MTLDDKPAPAVVDEEMPVIEVVEEPTVMVEATPVVVEATPIIEYVPPSPSRPAAATPKPARKASPTSAPDPFSVGVRVLKMAPAWLLFTTVCCSSLVLLLGWIRPAGDAAAAVTLPAKRNDARPANRASAADDLSAKTPAAPETAPPVNPASKATSVASDAPTPATAQPTTQPAPVAAPAAQPAPPAPPKVEEKAQAAPPVQRNESGGKFTAQVGSFNSQSEANERVSALRAAGFDSRAVAVELPGRGTWYRVQVGRFAERGEAAKAVAAMRAKGAAAAAIVVPVQN